MPQFIALRPGFDVPAPAPPSIADSLVISAVEGPTVHGDGPSAGRLCSVIRTGGCNLSCSYCDVPWTWDAKRYNLRAELHRVSLSDILGTIESHRTRFTVITGGEPLLHQHQPAWRSMLAWLEAHNHRVEVETNGTIAPTLFTAEHVTQFNVAPKLANSGDREKVRVRPDAVRAMLHTGRAVWTFVCASIDDVDEVAAVVAAHELPRENVWVVPEGTTPAQVVARLAVITDRAVAHGFNVTARLQALVWSGTTPR